jgi:hypothetical protein
MVFLWLLQQIYSGLGNTTTRLQVRHLLDDIQTSCARH